MTAEPEAPGRPGIEPTWSSSARDTIATGHPQFRDLGFHGVELTAAQLEDKPELKSSFRFPERDA